MPTTSTEKKLLTSTLKHWYCEECAIGSNYTPGMSKETKKCSVCEETKECSHPIDMDIGAYMAQKRQTTPTRATRATGEIYGFCPSCESELDHVDYREDGIVAYGTCHLPDGDNETDDTNYDGSSCMYTCPECGHESSDYENFVTRREDESEDEQQAGSPLADDETKEGENV